MDSLLFEKNELFSLVHVKYVHCFNYLGTRMNYQSNENDFCSRYHLITVVFEIGSYESITVRSGSGVLEAQWRLVNVQSKLPGIIN